MKTILDTLEISELVHSKEYKQELSEGYDTCDDADDIPMEWLWEDEGMIFEEEQEYISHELERFVKRYEKRYKTSIAQLCFLGTRSSRYGWIGGNGSSVGKATPYGSKGLCSSLFEEADRIALRITEDRKLELVTADHDGANFVELILVTEKEYEKAEEQYRDIREFLDSTGKNSTTLDREFLNAFGYFNKENQVA